MNKKTNIITIVAAAIVLVALNVGVFMAAGSGAVSPINNILLWGGFAVLNVASILWAITLLGLQPLVVTCSYVAGGALAYFGVRNMTEISVAEITTAGATYGAFGALAVGNATTKVRLAFFNKGQVPFIFVIIGLLVIDAGLNSQVSRAGVSVLLNVVALPFIGAGVAVGAVWSIMNKFGIGKRAAEVLVERDAAMAQGATATGEDQIVIPMPETVQAAPVEKVEQKPVIVPAVQTAPKRKAKPEPVRAETAPVEPKKEEPFFPLELDKDGEPNPSGKVDPPEFDIPVFDDALYASGSQDDNDMGGVLVQEPVVAEKTVAAESKTESEEEKFDMDDFLGGHLDLLSKLK
ncbi:hypothetical protein [Pontiella agarivorans]|uniref:Uncharacterized protein n=1 Tax=Pontiella agarivorans TaxID=3038953 RepID=A0ABU5N0G3_9BACT|nr:hypothetical protein [Pontiella agarivorans]MDZ8119937.1 hypothetical protein [Pontiella agarivorans]